MTPLAAPIGRIDELEGRVRFLTDHDPMTGLFNRRCFDEALTCHRLTGTGGALLMVDLDGFKGVNDHLGHAVGDELLRSLSASLQARSRASDVLARLSGDEFALLLPGADRMAAEIVAEQVVCLIGRHRSGVASDWARVTASVGVALFGAGSDADVLALADAAMHAAKDAGRDRYVVFDAADPLPPKSRRAGEASRLHRALAEERFVLHCQPVLKFGESRVDAYELLVRMRSEVDDSLIAPNAFLYAAERFGLISAIDSWVVTQAVDLIAAHARKGRRLELFVNLSGHSMADPAVAVHVDEALARSGIDPSCLIFEVTETAAIGNVEAAVAFSEQLRRRGCRFALDDFGSGFASFYYLKRLPFDFLKIDGDFIRGLRSSRTDQLIVGAIVAIARGMGKQTIAEFVADEETCQLLRSQGVDFGQGFHIGRPMPIEDLLPQ